MTSIPLLRSPLLASVCLAGIAAQPLFAQERGDEAPPPRSELPTEQADSEDAEIGTGGGEIVVNAQRLRGQLDVEQEPILELNEDDIAAEGVTSIADLITQITNQSGSARGRNDGGRPVILINGIRVGSFREFRNYPPEALARVEVFPEEVAQRFGFPPDRRVINLILKENYRNAEVEFEFEGPSRGGNYNREQELGFLQIADGGRINFNFEANDQSLLTEDERDIIQTPGSISDVAGDPDQAPFRSLRADSRSLDANISWAKAIIDSGVSLSANLNYERNDTRSLQGLNTVFLTDDPDDPDAGVLRTFGQDTPLEIITAQDVVQTSGSLTKPVNAFRLTSTFDAGLSETTQFIDQRFDTTGLQADALAGLLELDGPLPTSVDSGTDTAFTRTISASTLNTLRGPIANLPAGELLATFDIGYDWTNVDTLDSRNNTPVELTRGDLSTGVNLVIPITSSRTGFADALGSFTINAQAGLNHLSDFGTLGDYTIGLNWGVTDKLSLSANYIVREVAPDLTSLGNPEVQFFNVPTFDFTNGETLLATVTTGGNPDLLAETQRDWKFAANWELPFVDNTRFTVEYIRNRSEDVTRSFPIISPEIEAAFPDRITRDADGTLIAVDRRFVTFAETRANRLQFGLFTRGTIGAGQQGGRPGGGPPGGGRPRGGPPASSDTPPANGAAGPPRPGGPRGAGGPPSAEQRQQFMAFRERLCADDGLAFVTRLVRAVENGEDLSAEMPGFDPERFERILSRIRDDNDEISDERIAGFRERLCSMGPGGFGGRRGGRGGPPRGGEGSPDAQAGQAAPMARAGGPPGSGGPGATEAGPSSAFREKACGEDGIAAIRELIGKIERGEDVSAELPGVDPQFIKLGLDQSRDENGNIPDAALERFRSQFCAGGPSEQAGGQSGRQGGGPAFNPLQRRNFRGFRYFVSLNHSIELDNEILIAPGLDVLDQLAGDGTGATGLSRHFARLEAGIFGSGVGMRLSGRYTGSARLNGSDVAGSSDIFFDDLVTFDLRLFSEIGQLVGKNEGVLKNLRVSLRADNIFDAQRRVTDENGDTPLNYQPFLLDPVGRYIGIDIRKLF